MMVRCTSEQQHQIRILTNTVHTLSSTVLEMKQEHAQSRHSTNQHADSQQTLGGNHHHRHISGDTSHHVCGGNSGSVNISPSESGSGRGGDVLRNPGDIVDVGGNNDISNGNDGDFGRNDTGDDAFAGVVPVLHIGGNSLHGGIDAGAGVVDTSGHVGCSPSTTGGGDGLGSHCNDDRIGGSSINEVGVSHGNGNNDGDVDLVNAGGNSRKSNNNDSTIQDLIQIDNDDMDNLDLAEFGLLHNNNST